MTWGVRMEFDPSESPEDDEEHAEEFSDVLEDLMDDVHERISTGKSITTDFSDSVNPEFADIIDENIIDTINPEHVENESAEDESGGGFWYSPLGNLVTIFVIIIWFFW